MAKSLVLDAPSTLLAVAMIVKPQASLQHALPLKDGYEIAVMESSPTKFGAAHCRRPNRHRNWTRRDSFHMDHPARQISVVPQAPNIPSMSSMAI